MNIREWIADNIGYKFGGCAYAKTHDRIFNPIQKLIPKDFLGRKVSDLGCGDCSNTLRIKKLFQVKDIVGFERNPYLIQRARNKGLKVKKLDLNDSIPKGELATFSFALHHIKDKVNMLQQVKRNFKYIFLIEPMKDLYHALFDAGYPLSEKDWIKVFDAALGEYQLHRQGNNLIVFYRSKS